MKIRCSCGAKYEFDVTPGMAPVSFVCPACGLDASEYVNNLVRQELGQTQTPPPVPSAARPSVQVRVHTPAAPPSESPPLQEAVPVACPKHPGEHAVDKCYMCSKPICPKCMELLGHLCSPLCKAKAESHGIDIPVFTGQKSVIEAKFWRKVGWAGVAASTVLVCLLGFWFWYAWFGSVPKAVFSVRFPEPSFSGRSAIIESDQVVFLHGDTLARYAMKPKQAIWSRRLFDPKRFEAQAAERIKEMQEAAVRVSQVNPEARIRIPSGDRLAARLEREAAAALDLRVEGRNIWVAWPDKLVRYDWDTGKPAKEIPTSGTAPIPVGDELVLMEGASSEKLIMTRINLSTCESRAETLGGPPPGAGNETNAALPNPGLSKARNGGLAGLPLGMPGKEAGKAMDPGKVAEQARHLGYPSRIALPVLLANSRNQERMLAELKEPDAQKPSAGLSDSGLRDSVSFIPTKDGLVKYSVRLIEARIVERNAMKAAPAKSVLDGNLTVAKTEDMANETLNEMQRERGGATVREDHSRYRVNVGDADGKGAWSGEVIGTPGLYCLRTVNVLAGIRSVLIFSKDFRLLWQAQLNYNFDGEEGVWGEGEGLFGKGPVVEHKDGLFLYDEGVLTAFALANGSVRWRLPSVGTEGLFFDDEDNLFVNTTTANVDKIKFSRQIDISEQTQSVILKIDSRTGKVLWRQAPGAPLCYVSGKFIYAARWYVPEEPDDDGMPPIETGFETPPYLRIKRLDSKTGREMWEHFQQRAPLDIQCDKNVIRLVFKKEVLVLKCLVL